MTHLFLIIYKSHYSYSLCVWVCGCVGGWVGGCVGVWVGGWVCGWVCVWVCGCVGVWVCGCVGVWVCGCVCVCSIQESRGFQCLVSHSNNVAGTGVLFCGVGR